MSDDLDQTFSDGDAPILDKTIANSVIAQYVGGQLHTLTGHFQSLEPNQYAAMYQRWGGQIFLLERCRVTRIEEITKNQSN
jgi:hypothetical protein